MNITNAIAQCKCDNLSIDSQLQKMGSYLLIAFVAFFLSSCCSEEDPVDKDQFQFFTSDIDLFWEVYDKHQGILTSATIRDQYINAGSPGLRDYSDQKNLQSGIPQTLNSQAYKDYYESIRNNTQELSSALESMKVGLDNLEKEFPAIKKTDVYLLIGALTAGGRISKNGLLIAVEMFTKNEDTSLDELSEWHQNVIRSKTYLPSIVLHESIHIQQLAHAGGLNLTTVLEQSIIEGMADFIAYYVLPDKPFMNEHLHAYGDPREEELWKEFESEIGESYRDTEWLYTGKTTSKGHPADMGYYIGYKIVESYSATFSSMTEAIEAMLTTNDYNGILTKSGYSDKFK